MTKPTVLVIDVGTTVAKTSLFDFTCRPIDRISCAHPAAGLDVAAMAESLWRMVKESVPALLRSNPGCRVAGVGLTGFMHAVIPLDQQRAVVPLPSADSTARRCFDEMVDELEVYRRAVAEYGVPKEMLSDQGRQYSSWRGTTRFEAELRKDRVHHIKSRPHHPMTLGKIERFWKTIWEEFLERAQFDSFESACERIRLWVKHYNHRRPHQSLDGLCPADRFFAIAQELRQVIERGIQDNVLELALRGQPRSPFYMVGRMGEQSVVIRAEKGQVMMLVDGEEPRPHQEVIYNRGRKGRTDSSTWGRSSRRSVRMQQSGYCLAPGNAATTRTCTFSAGSTVPPMPKG